MKYCGIELKGSEARIISIDHDGEDYEFIAINIKKIKLNDTKSQEAARSFRADFQKLFGDNDFNKIAVKERGTKGKFAGGAASFKMEGLIQSLDYNVEVIHTATIKSRIKDKKLNMAGINNYQEEALKVALSLV